MNGKSAQPSPSDVETLFNAAVGRPRAERAAYLDGACAKNALLRDRVEALLRAHDASTGFLPEQPAAASPVISTGPAVVAVTEKPGDTIGRYKLLEKLGEGGFGVVYMAEQREPVKRRVALKIIKVGMDTKEVVARFEAERQALAMMDHPNIAKVLDGGATSFAESQISNLKSQIPQGRPYFVMELVRGIKITDFCDQNHLGLRERLELFMQVCHAVQHAHQKGIIHRDLKPSNILVTINDGVPVPKVIDFGIAKATQQELTEKTLFTAYGQFMGTPAYMSPEQAVMTSLDIDTRSDIYSLGVLLYELLTGKPPFDTHELLKIGLDELCRTLREVEPPRPSTRLSTMAGEALAGIAKFRKTDAPKLVHYVRGDLDWIVMKCLEKDRARRYETANGLAADIQRHLHNEPVVARPPSAAYRFQKLVRRNKLAFAAAGAVTAALLIGIAASTWQAVRATRAEHEQTRLRQDAQTEAIKSQQVAQFLKDMLSSVRPSSALGRDTQLLREVLENAAVRLDKDLTNQPLVEAELRGTIAMTYMEMGDYATARRYAERALALRQSRLGTNDAGAANYLLALGRVAFYQGLNQEADQLYGKGLSLCQRALGPEHGDTLRILQALAALRVSQARYTEAEQMATQALATRRRIFGGEDPETLRCMELLALVYDHQHEYAKAEPLYKQRIEVMSRLRGSNNLDTLLSLEYLGIHYGKRGRRAESESILTNALARAQRVYGLDHPAIARFMLNAGMALKEQGRFAEAGALMTNAWEVSRRHLGPDHENTLAAQLALAILFSAQARYAEAEPLYRDCVETSRRVRGAEDSETMKAVAELAKLYTKQKRDAEAAPLYAELLAFQRKAFGEDHHETIGTLLELEVGYVQQGRFAEAERLLTNAMELLRRPSQVKASQKVALINNLELRYANTGRTNEAEALLREFANLGRQQAVADPSREDEFLVGTIVRLSNRVQGRGDLAEARTLAEEALALYQRHPDWLFERGVNIRDLSFVWKELGDQARYDALKCEALSAQLRSPSGATEEQRALARQMANERYRQQAFSQAEMLYRSLIETLPAAAGAEADERLGLTASLARALADWSWVEWHSITNAGGLKSIVVERAREAERLLRDVLPSRRRQWTNSWRLADLESRLGGALVSVAASDSSLPLVERLDKVVEAEKRLIKSHEALLSNTRPDAEYKSDSFERLRRLYEAWDDLAPNTGKAEKAAEWKQKSADFEKTTQKSAGAEP